MNIPILNIYYLLCYAWNKLEEIEPVNVHAIDTTELIDLFAKVLITGTTKLLKQGLDRYYVEYESVVNGIKGKLNLSASIKENYLPLNKTVCSYDEFDYDILHNQILRTTIGKLLKTKTLDNDLRIELRKLFNKLSYISEVKIRSSDFNRIRLHRNNYHYDFILKVCRIINDNLLIDESSGTYKFSNFSQDEEAMRRLYEAFVRNFYKKEQSEYEVRIEHIKWNLTSENESDMKFVPNMRTDISLISPHRKIIIDAKYTPNAFQTGYFGEQEKITSGHLYQLFSYLLNQETGSKITEYCDGILLYPTVDDDFVHTYKYNNHEISVRSINLNQDWRTIEGDLLKMISPLPAVKAS